MSDVDVSQSVEAFTNFPLGQRKAIIFEPVKTPPKAVLLYAQLCGESFAITYPNIEAQAKRLAATGYVCVVFQAFGCGESAGDSTAISLRIWRQDLMRATHIFRTRWDCPLILWGQGFGTLLMSDLLISQTDTVSALLCWNPMSHGSTWVNSFIQTSNGRFRDKLSSQGRLVDGVEVPESFANTASLLSLSPTSKLDKLSGIVQVGFFAFNPTHSPERRIPAKLLAIRHQWVEAGFVTHVQGVPQSNPVALFEATENWLGNVLLHPSFQEVQT